MEDENIVKFELDNVVLCNKQMYKTSSSVWDISLQTNTHTYTQPKTCLSHNDDFANAHLIIVQLKV